MTPENNLLAEVATDQVTILAELGDLQQKVSITGKKFARLQTYHKATNEFKEHDLLENFPVQVVNEMQDTSPSLVNASNSGKQTQDKRTDIQRLVD